MPLLAEGMARRSFSGGKPRGTSRQSDCAADFAPLWRSTIGFDQLIDLGALRALPLVEEPAMAVTEQGSLDLV
jgi:hypothetical protein